MLSLIHIYSGAPTKITINNRRLNKADFEQTILIPMADDGLDKYRKEYNKMLLELSLIHILSAKGRPYENGSHSKRNKAALSESH